MALKITVFPQEGKPISPQRKPILCPFYKCSQQARLYPSRKAIIWNESVSPDEKILSIEVKLSRCQDGEPYLWKLYRIRALFTNERDFTEFCDKVDSSPSMGNIRTRCGSYQQSLKASSKVLVLSIVQYHPLKETRTLRRDFSIVEAEISAGTVYKRNNLIYLLKLVSVFPYCDNNVTNFWSTSEIVSAGKEYIKSAFRARQSKLLTWSDKTTPAIGNPAGRRTSNG